jgi:hypothetical protein
MSTMRGGCSLARVAVITAVALLSLVAVQPTRAALVATGRDDSYSVSHDHTLSVAAPGVLGNDLNLLGSSTAVLQSGVAHGSLTLRSNGSFTYQPDTGYVGSDSFRYKPNGLLSTAATVRITVTNAAPVARADSYTWGGGTLTVAAPGVLANDTDADGDSLTAELVGGGVSGSLDLDPNGGFQLKPGGGFGSSGSFQYRVSDGRIWSPAVTVTLTISGASATPVPTPVPTPRPTPTPLPSLPLPSMPLPSLPGVLLTPRPIATPSEPQVDASGRPTPSRSAAPSDASPSVAPVLPGSGGLPPGGGSGPGQPATGFAAPAVFSMPSADRIDLGLGLGDLNLLAGFETWAVPAATVGGVGFLVLLFIGLQAGGTVIWVPAVRRLRGERTPRRRRRAFG